MAKVNLGNIPSNPRGSHTNVNTDEKLDTVLIDNQAVEAGAGNEPDVLTGTADVINSLSLNAQDGTEARIYLMADGSLQGVGEVNMCEYATNTSPVEEDDDDDDDDDEPGICLRSRRSGGSRFFFRSLGFRNR